LTEGEDEFGKRWNVVGVIQWVPGRGGQNSRGGDFILRRTGEQGPRRKTKWVGPV